MLKKLQAGTGVIFAIFVVVHLVNTWTASFGSLVYDGIQRTVQTVYQFPPVEVLLLAALAVHVVVGVMRIVKEPKRTLSTRAKWHRYAGFFLMVVILGHVLAVRGPSWFFDIYPGFAGLSFSVQYMPAIFFPYYFLLGMAGFYHAINGLTIALPRLGMGFGISSVLLQRFSIVSAVFMFAALLGFYGVWTDVGNAYESDFAKLALELIGADTPQ